jgi:hypothetical protein
VTSHAHDAIVVSDVANMTRRAPEYLMDELFSMPMVERRIADE